MPSRSWRFRIEDILEAIARIEEYAAGMDYAAFCEDSRTVDAVVRNLEIIGEAASHVPEDAQAECPGIPWDKMRDMRHVLVHEYFGVSLPIVWETLREDLPPLVPLLRSVL